MPQFFSNLLRSMGGPRGSDMQLLCRQLLSQRGEASQTVLARRIFAQYQSMSPVRKLEFFEMLAAEFGLTRAQFKKRWKSTGLRHQRLVRPRSVPPLKRHGRSFFAA